MKSPVLGIPIVNVSFADQVLPGEPEAAAATDINDGLILCDDCKQDIGMINHKDSVVSDWMARFRVKANKRVQGIREYVHSGPSISQSLKGKLSFFQKKTGGVERVFRKAFSIKGKEKLLKSSQCYLSTTTGPISGMLFISTERIAFLSNTSLQLTSHYGEITRFRYKVMIPLARIKNAIPIDNNLDMPKGKYIQIVTVDEFDFWFMGFVHYHSFFNNFQKTIPGPH